MSGEGGAGGVWGRGCWGKRQRGASKKLGESVNTQMEQSEAGELGRVRGGQALCIMVSPAGDILGIKGGPGGFSQRSG